MATEMITNRNFAREACNSRQAIFAAEAQVSERFLIGAHIIRPLHGVFDDHAVAQNDAAIGVGRDLRIVGHQHQGCAAGAISFEQQIEYVGAVFGIEIAGGFVGKNDGRLQTKARARATRCCSPPES